MSANESRLWRVKCREHNIGQSELPTQTHLSAAKFHRQEMQFGNSLPQETVINAGLA